MTRRSIRSCLGWGLLLLLAGCGKRVGSSELVGVYVAEYPVAKEQLTIAADGTFAHRLTIKSNLQTVLTNGTWRFDPADSRITFHDSFLNVLDGFDRPLGRIEAGTADFPVMRWFGKICIDGGPGIEYRKVAPKPSK